MWPPVHILLVCGSVRAGSTNAAVLQTAGELIGDGVTATLYDGLASLPHFNPDDDRESEPDAPAVARLRAAIDASDALLTASGPRHPREDATSS